MLALTFEEASAARRYVQETELPWPLLIDERRGVYAAYDMGRASLAQIWAPATLRAYARHIAHGERPRWSHADVRQQGGDVLIDPDGIVLLHHVGKGPADRLPVEKILGAARA